MVAVECQLSGLNKATESGEGIQSVLAIDRVDWDCSCKALTSSLRRTKEWMEMEVSEGIDIVEEEKDGRVM